MWKGQLKRFNHSAELQGQINEYMCMFTYVLRDRSGNQTATSNIGGLIDDSVPKFLIAHMLIAAQFYTYYDTLNQSFITLTQK